MINKDLAQVILVDKPEVVRTYKYFKESDNLGDVQVMTLEALEELRHRLSLRMDNRRPAVGDTFILSPFDDNTYIEINRFESDVLKEKASKMAEVLQLLGARHFLHTIKTIDAQEREWNNKTGLTIKAVEATSDITNKKEQELSNTLTMEDSFDPDSVSEEGRRHDYEKAIDLVKKYRLDNDVDITTLLNTRNPEQNNLHKSHRIKWELSKELSSSLDVAITLKAQANLFSLTNTFESCVKNKYKIIIETKIDF